MTIDTFYSFADQAKLSFSACDKDTETPIELSVITALSDDSIVVSDEDGTLKARGTAKMTISRNNVKDGHYVKD